MPMDPKFNQVPVNVPKLSGADLSHRNLLTTKCGTITPILVDELIPGTHVNLKAAIAATLPPLASETFMNVDLKLEAFFVPSRLLYGGFENWFTDFPIYRYQAGADLKPTIPFFNFGNNTAMAAADFTYFDAFFKPGTLLDYLGVCVEHGATGTVCDLNICALPILAYSRIYDDWYRATKVQRPLFHRVSSGNSSDDFADIYQDSSVLSSLPYFVCDSVSGDSCVIDFDAAGTPNSPSDYVFDDGVSLFALRQRNFDFDYFTTALTEPQQGPAIEVAVPSPDASGANSFTIAALRAMNSLQQFRDRNGLPGERLQEQLYARYGVSLKDGVAQRSLFLGSQSFSVYSHGVTEVANTPSASSASPFAGQLGNTGGKAYASGSGELCDDFVAHEPGYLFVMASIVPSVTYGSGIRRYLTKYIGSGSIVDMGNPILQNVGPQPIYQRELTFNPQTSSTIFGYTDRYAEYKVHENELHGLLRDGQSLQSFALQRNFDQLANPVISSAFLQIPTDYMDQVTAVAQSVSDYGVWIDSYFDYKVALPLSRYSLPTLQDPAYEHGETITIHRGGYRL